MSRQIKKIAGNKYNKLTAIKPTQRRTKKGDVYWLFKCECGREKEIVASKVKVGKTKSCGCLVLKHGNARRTTGETSEYKVFKFMHQRCYNKKHDHYSYYGGRGITVCERWSGKNGFINFLEDMGKRPKGKSLDRINNHRGYSPDNCRWADHSQQMKNMRIKAYAKPYNNINWHGTILAGGIIEK